MIVPRIGPRLPLLVGVLLSTSGLAWLSQVAAHGTYWGSVFGGSELATFGMGLAMTPLAFAATAGVAREEAGLASGLLNTSRQVGGSVALAALATIAADRTHAVLGEAHGAARLMTALSAGYGRAFAVSAVLAFVGATGAALVPRTRPGDVGATDASAGTRQAAPTDAPGQDALQDAPAVARRARRRPSAEPAALRRAGAPDAPGGAPGPFM